jgi:hypothetical protein
MTFGRTVLWGTIVWVAAISLLHASLNWGLFEARHRDEGRKFSVGFLPVT